MIVTDPKIENPVLRMVGETADQLGLECYVVGGWIEHQERKELYGEKKKK